MVSDKKPEMATKKEKDGLGNTDAAKNNKRSTHKQPILEGEPMNETTSFMLLKLLITGTLILLSLKMVGIIIFAIFGLDLSQMVNSLSMSFKFAEEILWALVGFFIGKKF